MKTRIDVAGHVYVMLTILLTVYGQLVLKWQIEQAGPMPEHGAVSKLAFLLGQLTNPWIFSGLAAAFLASLAWMAAMTRLELNYAYPFMSLAFVLVMAFSILFLNESLSLTRVTGTVLVVTGLYVMTRS